MRRFLRWLNGDRPPPKVCAAAMRCLLEPIDPHPAGAHVCRKDDGHLRYGSPHWCRYCPVEWGPR